MWKSGVAAGIETEYRGDEGGALLGPDRVHSYCGVAAQFYYG